MFVLLFVLYTSEYDAYYCAMGEKAGALGSSDKGLFDASCSSTGTMTQIPWIERETVRNTFSPGNLYFRDTVRTSPSVPHLISCTLPKRYVDLISLRYLIRQMSPTCTFR